ncbi:MAG: FMN-binding glutamate synthase family protein [Phycisphaerae bacterium]
MIRTFYLVSAGVFAAVFVVALAWPPVVWSLVMLVPLFLLGIGDTWQTRHAVIRNFPVIGRFRYLLELIRPEINQYFIESNTDGTPFNRELRSVIYQRAKQQRQTLPFGTQRDVYRLGYEWINHSLAATTALHEAPRIKVGGPACKHPYHASPLNISAMSFGSLSSAAIAALNGGAKAGGFYHNTGEGSISPYHLKPGGDLVWQIGTGYFGCRDAVGGFDEQLFAERAGIDQVKMIEIKLSQGAKPGHGGILPASKITPEIAAIRHVPLGEAVISPPAHRTFDSPRGLVEFVQRLRDLSGGKPVGFKLCVGSPVEFLAICKAMIELSTFPDFITVDGAEGGTGAAPLEFSNSVGAPLTDGLVFVHDVLTGYDIRNRIRIIASGKIVTGFHMAARLAAGADLCNCARGFMFALGCIQARRCNSNVCPVGVATQDPALVRGLVVGDKIMRVACFHEETVDALLEILAAAGLSHPNQLRPWHVQRRVSHMQIKNYAEIYEYMEPGALLHDAPPNRYRRWLKLARSDTFGRM